jgi:DNA-binding NtrC family response regulator
MNTNLVSTGRARILVVDDVQENLNLLSEVLERAGYIVSIAPRGEIAIEISKINPPDLILLDIVMPEMDGFETCQQLKAMEDTKHIPILFISARDELDNILQSFQSGGVDYINKPFRNEELLARVETHLRITLLTTALRHKNRELEQVNERLVSEITKRQHAENETETAQQQLTLNSKNEANRWGLTGFIGKSTTCKTILDRIKQLHNFGDVNVLITGESGTGKELVARAIHAGGTKSHSPFIPVNCSAIPAELAESLFFGHQKGAFSGATNNKKGYFELANGGTLFLDEIGEMPKALQPKLLRILEDGVVNPAGSGKQIPVNLRVIAASNINFHSRMNEGAFREDLYFRLARFTVKLPPLRDRREDIPLLVDHFLRLFAQEMNRPVPKLTADAVAALNQYHYRGNVRELKNLIERGMIESGQSIIDIEHLLFFDDPFMSDDPMDSGSGHPSSSDDNYDKSTLFEKYKIASEKLQHSSFRPGTKNAMSKILTHLRDHAVVDNQRCRAILNHDQMKVSYLLKKMHNAKLIQGIGSGRWAQYRLR